MILQSLLDTDLYKLTMMQAVLHRVGTNLTNDLGPTPLNIVIKMVRCNGQPVAKVSDSPGKGMCDDPNYLAYLRQVFDLPAEKRF